MHVRRTAAETPTRGGTKVAVRAAAIAALLVTALLPAAPAAARSVGVLVRESNPSSAAAERAVQALGGQVTRPLPIVDGFSARIPRNRVSALAANPSVAGVSLDSRVRMASGGSDTSAYDLVDPSKAWRWAIRLGAVPEGIDGTGVTVATLDTGLAPSPDLDGRVLARVDFTPGAAGGDGFGHGTHVAGVIAGDGASSDGKWRGVATDARLVSVKVADGAGATDVSVVIAALQWIVSHRDQYGIRVLNLSFGTDSLQPHAIDPLNAAIERAWSAGIVVVVSAGNRGSEPGTINKPADDPYVISVGAVDWNATYERSDDIVAPFSSRGPTQDGLEKPDLVAPGTSIVSLRARGSTVDQDHPDARVGEDYFKGTGTSQAAGVISGVAALLLEANPALTPDQVKAVLMGTAHGRTDHLDGGGAGMVDAEKAVEAATNPFAFPNPNAGLLPSDGSGSLHQSRGSFLVDVDLDGDGQPEVLRGERDVLGDVWDSDSWSSSSWSVETWGSSPWAGLIAENPGWEKNVWSSTAWSGMSWSSVSWSSVSWSSVAWSSVAWS